MKQILVLLSFVALALPASAITMDFDFENITADMLPSVEMDGEVRGHHGGGEGHGHKQMCKGFNFSKVQKTAYTEAREMFMAETAQLRKKMSLTKQRYFRTLMNTNVSGEVADQLANRMGHMGHHLMAARTNLFHTIVYDIASIDQRKPLLRCVKMVRMHMLMKKLKKMKKGHHGKKKEKTPVEPPSEGKPATEKPA